MGGFFGVVSNGDCVRDVFYGTDYHSHLGTKRGGIAVSKGDGRFQRRIHDISNSQFRSKFDAEIGDFEGNAAIGIISDTDDQPLVISGRFGVFAIVTVGKINNIEEIAQLISLLDKLFGKGAFAESIRYLQELVKNS